MTSLSILLLLAKHWRYLLNCRIRSPWNSPCRNCRHSSNVTSIKQLTSSSTDILCPSICAPQHVGAHKGEGKVELQECHVQNLRPLVCRFCRTLIITILLTLLTLCRLPFISTEAKRDSSHSAISACRAYHKNNSCHEEWALLCDCPLSFSSMKTAPVQTT